MDSDDEVMNTKYEMSKMEQFITLLSLIFCPCFFFRSTNYISKQSVPRQNLECYQKTILSLLPLHYMPLLQNNINYSLTTTVVVPNMDPTYCLTHLGQLQFSPPPLRNFLYIYNCTIITRDKNYLFSIYHIVHLPKIPTSDFIIIVLIFV